MAIKIMLDAGHFSGWNKYTVIGNKISEGEVVWDIFQYLKPMLENYGFIVGTTKKSINDYPKTSSGDDDIVTRGRMAKGYDIFISLHTNACEAESVNRPVVIYPVSGKLKDLSAKIGENIQKCGGWQNYQIFNKWNSSGTADYYGVIRGAASVGVPGIIIEHTFHTNRNAANWLCSSDNRKKIAQVVADTIASYYGYMNGEITSIQKDNKGEQIYRVRKTWADYSSQIGAYKNLESAKSVCDANSGYYVFDESGNILYPKDNDGEKVVASNSSLTKYTFKSSKEASVYCDTSMTTKIGSLNKGEECSCVVAGDSLVLCWYKLDNSNSWKAGYVLKSNGTLY